MKLYIVSGTSGAGKTIALHALEDLGFYCIDNLPLALLPAFASEAAAGSRHHAYESAAVGIDARNLTDDLAAIGATLEQLRSAGIDTEVIFVDADDATLLKRFSETRRPHPLAGNEVPLEEAIHQERLLLKPISARADMIVDTSRTNVHQLRDLIQKRVGTGSGKGMSLLFESFGFKHGIPIEADFVFDIRCLPNPHWEPRLRALTGRDPEVAQFLEQHTDVNELFTDIVTLLNKWLPKFEADNRSYMTVAIGCTGGQHRSVYFIERLASHFRTLHAKVLTRHRELS
ncbi:MAG TPA: RNase adapter RapZ [Gammaproteobacteria bacterium]